MARLTKIELKTKMPGTAYRRDDPAAAAAAGQIGICFYEPNVRSGGSKKHSWQSSLFTTDEEKDFMHTFRDVQTMMPGALQAKMKCTSNSSISSVKGAQLSII